MNKHKFESVRFYVTHACNSRCIYCDTYRNEEYRKISFMELEDAKELIRQFQDLGCKYIDFTGGEPTLHPQLPQLLSYARSLGIRTEVTTNGLSDGDAHLLKCAARSNVFNISLDTLHGELYAQIRGVDGLEKVLHSIDAVAKLRQDLCMEPLKLMVVVSEKNLTSLPSLLHYAREKGAELYLNPQFSYGSESGQCKTHHFFETLLPYVFSRNAIVPLHFLELYRDVASGIKQQCASNRNILTLDADGSLMLPCYPAKRHTWLPCRGNLQEALEKEVFQEEASRCGKMPECENCMFTPYYGFSFQTLGKYFLLESFCERMTRLKRDYLNPLGIDTESKNLIPHLLELLQILRTLKTPHPVPDGRLYWAEVREQVYTDVYQKPISLEQFMLEQKAESCWDLSALPHILYDDINTVVFRPAFLRIQSAATQTQNLAVLFERAIEFMLRWWKVCIASRLKVDAGGDLQADSIWLADYLSEVRMICRENQLVLPSLPNEILQFMSDEEQPPVLKKTVQPDWNRILMDGKVSSTIGLARMSLPLSTPTDDGRHIRGYHVFSTEPFRMQNTGTDFFFPEYQRRTMELSARLWRRYNGPIRLITDALGYDYLARYGLLDLYEEVLSLQESDVYGIDCQKFWASGKILALKGLDTPCAIIDLDLLIWQRLSLAGYPLVTLHKESLNELYYPGFNFFQMDPSYQFYKEWDESVEPLNTAFLYLSDEELKDFYVSESIRFMRNERNTPDLDGSVCMVFAEQRILAMCAAAQKKYVKTLLDYNCLSHPQPVITHLWSGKEVFEQYEELQQTYNGFCCKRLSECQ